MPCNYKRDYSPEWKAISDRIRFVRAEGQCEQCKAPHGHIVARSDDGRYMLDGGETYNADNGTFLGYSKGSEFVAVRHTLIVLTTAHLDHNTKNDAEDNLKALCQKCHLAHDAADNARRRKYGKDFIARAPGLFD